MRNPHMKFQDSSFNGLKVTVGTKSVTHATTNGRSKSNMPHQLFQSWGHNKKRQWARQITLSGSGIRRGGLLQATQKFVGKGNAAALT